MLPTAEEAQVLQTAKSTPVEDVPMNVFAIFFILIWYGGGKINWNDKKDSSSRQYLI